MDIFQYLRFSDAAKFATIARNLSEGNGFVTDFSFWGVNLFSTGGISFLTPYIISIFFKFFGLGDVAVIAFSLFFYILLGIFVFLLGKKLHSTLVGALSSLAVLSNLNFIDYATSGASETLFAFEIILALYFLSFKKIWINVFGLLVLGLMYFTRPQAFIYMAGISLFWLIYRFGFKRGILTFFGLSFVGLTIDKFVIYPLSFKFPLTPVLIRGLQSILSYSSYNAVSDNLRGAASSTLSLPDVAKKVFYNLYNFYKALPSIGNPYLWALFFIGLFVKTKDNLQFTFKVATVFTVLITFIVTALTIPFYRYLHPVIPLVCIIAITTLVNILQSLSIKKFVPFISSVLVLVFTVGLTLGHFILDSRFEAKRVNSGKPPVYAVLSYKLKEITYPTDIILTNLDTWGSWYGERKTVWFPLTPQLFLNSKHDFDAIYLTSYKIDDENYYMGKEWREVFENPKEQEILKDYEYVNEYTFSANDNFEKENARAILFRKK